MGNGVSRDSHHNSHDQISPNGSGNMVNLTYVDKSLIAETWAQVGDKRALAVDIHKAVFLREPSLLSAFRLNSADDFHYNPRTAEHLLKFANFLDQVSSDPELSMQDRCNLFRKLGVKHSLMKSHPTFHQIYFTIFVNAIVGAIMERLGKMSQDEREKARVAWQTYLEMMVSEMREAVFKHECRAMRRGTLHLALGFSQSQALQAPSNKGRTGKRPSC